MVQINTSGLQEPVFSGAYSQRMAAVSPHEAQPVETASGRQPQHAAAAEPASVSLSQESQAYADGGRAAAAAAAQTTQAVSSDPFEGTGDFKQQYQVFTQHLYDTGFFDRMTDAAVREAEQLLRDITSSMDAIAPESVTVNTEQAPSGAAAQVAYASSVEALHQFADQHLTGDEKDSFNGLVAAYKAHNRPIVDAHRNVTDRKDAAHAAARQSRSYTSRGEASDTSRSLAAKLGAIQHSADQKRKLRDAASASFREIRAGTMSIDAAINKAQNAFLSYASGDSQNGNMRSLLIQRNSALFSQMSAYWGVLMRA